jgi:hypothetical protein
MTELREVNCLQIGRTAHGVLRVEAPDGQLAMELEMNDLIAAWSGALGDIL